MSQQYTLLKAWAGHEAGATFPTELTEDQAAPLIQAGYLSKALSVEDLVIERVMKGLSPALAEIVSKALEPSLKALGNLAGSGPLGISGGRAEEDKVTKSFGGFLSAVLTQDVDTLTKVYHTTKAPLSEASGTGGGYLVPPEYLATLLRISAERGIVRPRARVVPMSTRTIQVPGLRQGGAGVAGQFQVLAGMVATWTEEAATRQETEPAFRQIELIAHELAAYSVASRTLMADSAVALDALLTGMFADTIYMYEDYAFLRGDGVGKPTGILHAPCTLETTRSAANTFKLVDAATMWSKLLPASQENAIWIMNQSVIPQLIQLQDAAGNVIFLPNFYNINGAAGGPSGVQASMVPMLFGRPIIFTEKLPVLGQRGDVLLADFSYYLLGDRQAIEIAASEHVNFLKNQMTWRLIHRVDGQPWLDQPYSYQDLSTKVSPFGVLV